MIQTNMCLSKHLLSKDSTRFEILFLKDYSDSFVAYPLEQLNFPMSPPYTPNKEITVSSSRNE